MRGCPAPTWPQKQTTAVPSRQLFSEASAQVQMPPISAGVPDKVGWDNHQIDPEIGALDSYRPQDDEGNSEHIYVEDVLRVVEAVSVAPPSSCNIL